MLKTSLQFLTPLEQYEREKPYAFNFDPGNSVPPAKRTNIRCHAEDVTITDVRENLQELEHGIHGVQYIKHVCDLIRGAERTESNMEQYCLEMTKLIQLQTGADRAICYDVRLRCSDRQSSDYLSSVDMSILNIAPPVLNAHTDHTPRGGIDRIRRYLTREEAQIYLSGQYRVRIINAWRPLRHRVYDCPLAFCDMRTVASNDLVGVDRIDKHFVTEMSYLKYNRDQKWMFLSHQAPDEVALFVQFDSRPTRACVLGCPHTAFMQSVEESSTAPRESVEVRVIVFNAIQAESEDVASKQS